ncbi:hypothetical protein C8K36_102473 [Rhodococcus sp. OK519]|uniref:hypothetical protein n=1 Tax=Rhodococcus sp. OK519 TaxID=2135729 RepID=UPI000D3A4925|nr:hypothetical protein C8K36_102473 [Rhodococcus sp. OK519]
MTDTITADEYRTAAKVLRTDEARDWLGSHTAFSAVWCDKQAARLEAESSRDEEAEKLAEVIAQAEQRATVDELVSWRQLQVRKAARAVLDQLAADGRLLPEGGTDLLPCNHCNGSGSETEPYAYSMDAVANAIAASIPGSGPDGTPEKPWPTADDIPADVGQVQDGSGNKWWRKRGGWCFTDGDGCGCSNSALRDALAPFVRVDGDKA